MNAPITTAVPLNVPVEFDLNGYVEKYIKLRDKIAEIKKRHDEELKPFAEAKGALDGLFGEHLTRMNTTSMRTRAGTITATERSSATLEDPGAFRAFVQNMGEWDLADIRANALAVKEWANANQQMPPGVKFSSIFTISVRRASAT